MSNYNDFEKLTILAPGGQVDGRLIFRKSIKGGWLVLYLDSICFVPDHNHEWTTN